MNKEEVAIIKNYLSAIAKERNAEIFLEPVDYVGLGIPDYPEIIKQPMDLSTIRKKIEDNKYQNVKEIYKDIQLIWDNCKRYNREGSDVYKMAQVCEKFTKRYFDKHNGSNSINNTIPSSKNNKKNIKLSAKGEEIKDSQVISETKENPQDILLDENEQNKEEEDDKNYDTENGLSGYEKSIISNRVKKLQNDGLASLVRLVQKECPNSIKETEDNIEIVLGSLDRKTFEQINRLIDTFLRVKETNQENLEQKKAKIN